MVDKEVFRAGYYYNLIEALTHVGDYVYQAPDDEKIVLTADHGEMITDQTVGHTDDVPIPWAKVGPGWEK